jgi:hypoxanthine-guanine phosphoribosyltransferase
VVAWLGNAGLGEYLFGFGLDCRDKCREYLD